MNTLTSTQASAGILSLDAVRALKKGPMRCLGIDPGLRGGYALIAPGEVMAEPFPLAGNSLDLAELYLEFSALEPDIAVIELIHSMPKDSAKAAFTFGKNCGQIEGALAALAIRIEYVTP